MESLSTVDVLSSPKVSLENSQITIKEESLCFEDKEKLSDKDESKYSSKDFGIFSNSQ